VIGLILRYGVVLTSLGVTFGLIAAWQLSVYMETLVWGVEATDPLTYLATAAVLTLSAVVAALLPAWRASGTDPLETLRAE